MFLIQHNKPILNGFSAEWHNFEIISTVKTKSNLSGKSSN